MKKIISLLLLLVLIASCSEDELFEVPRDANGNIIFTTISSTTSQGVSTLDDQFSVTATLPNAKSGDVMNVECLQLQIPAGSTSTTKQLLPLAGTQKTATVGADNKATITYTRTETKLVNQGEYVTVVFNGETDYAKKRVDLVWATVTTKPKVSGVEVDVARTDETAYFNVTVKPKLATYAGTLVVTKKNGKNDTPVAVTGSPFATADPFLVPISGAEFAADKDTMIYSFKSTVGSYTDDIAYTVIVRDPFFYLKKTGVQLVLGGAKTAGRNILVNTAVAATDSLAMLVVDAGSLLIHGGSDWLGDGNVITFVPSTKAMYDLNSTIDAIDAFEAGTPVTSADPIEGEGVYIYKMIHGPDADEFYGMIKATSVVPGVSVTLEYRIGNMYAHLAVIK